jgi:hypothetical protein
MDHVPGIPTLHDTILAVQVGLYQLEQQEETLAVEGHFLERIRALDVLVLRMLERIEDVQYVYGYHAELATWYHRAQCLWQRLEAVNAQLFRRLRAQLVAAPATGPLLRQMCETYVGGAAQASTATDTDYLDVFLNGVLGIDGLPEETKTLLPEMIAYHPTPGQVILALIAHAGLGAHDVFYDLGAGIGRVALLVGLLTAAHVKGIEFEPAYCAYAQQRAHHLRLSQVQFLNVDARAADYTDGTVFYLYTPFTGRLLQAVLARLQGEAHSRSITLATYGACTRDVMQQDWLRPTVQQTFAHDILAFFTSR